MRRAIPPILIIFVSGILILSIIPGCDELITNETTFEYFDTIKDSACIVLCHSDRNTVVEAARRRWAQSGHATGNLVDTTILGQNSILCAPQCHTSEGYIQAVDLIPGAISLTEYPTEIGCYTCHAPHTTFDFSRRDESPVTLISTSIYNSGSSNQCVFCHHSLVDKSRMIRDSAIIDASTVDIWDTLMYHGMGDADLLLGKGGFEHNFDSVTWTWSTVHSHSSGIARVCVTCHQDTVGDFSLGGHSLNIVNESGALVEACNIDACHTGTPSPVTAQSIAAGQALIETRLSDLKSGLSKLGLLNLETGLPDSTLLIVDSNVVGALYNYFFILNDKSKGMHNFVYDTLLLRASLDYLAGELPPPKK